MKVTSPPPADSLEEILSQCEKRACELFRRHRIPPDVAEALLVKVLPRQESLNGVLPGATHRLLKGLEADCRLRQTDGVVGGLPSTTGYQIAFKRAVQHLREQRLESGRERERCAAVVAAREDTWGNDSPPPEQSSKELVLELLKRTKRLWGSDPQRSLKLARAAREALRTLPRGSVRSRLLADLEARSSAYIGNALRLCRDYRAADRELGAGQSALTRGTRDPRERAVVLDLLAVLRRDQGRFPEALRHFEQVAAIYRWAGDRHREGQAFMSMATTQAYAGQPELAIPMGERALELLDGERAARMVAGATMNLVHYLWAAGRIEEAQNRLPRAQRLISRHGTPKDIRGLRWIEGQIEMAIGERECGQRLLLAVRREYLESDQGYEAALVGLELAAEYLDQGRSRDALRLAEETVPIFQSLEIHREVFAALITLRRAIEMETATAGLVRELIQRLQETRSGAAPRAEKPS